jgi:nitroreductase
MSQTIYTRIKSIVLYVPGTRSLVNTVQTGAKNIMSHVPGIRHWMWKRLLLKRMIQTESLISAAQSAVHAFDHFWIRGIDVPASLLVKTEVLLKEIAHREIHLDAPLLWTLQMYAIAKMGLQRNYLKPSEAESNLQDEVTIIDKNTVQSELVACIKGRRSVRLWKSKEVSLKDVQKFIEIAKWAPSSCNLQPWKVLLLTKSEDKEFLTRYYKATHNHFWSSAPLVLVVLANLSVYSNPMTPYVQLDSGAFIQNLLLLFHANGLAACWVGFLAWDNFGKCQIDESEREAFYARFGIPRDYLPTSLIPVGYSAVAPRPPARKSVNEIIVSGVNMPKADTSRPDCSGAQIEIQN